MNPSEIEILNTVVGGQRIIDMTALGFAQWIAGKVNGLSTYTPEVIELTSLVRYPPMGSRMSDESKINFVRKLMKLNVPIT